jgi:hypothetical protein
MNRHHIVLKSAGINVIWLFDPARNLLHRAPTVLPWPDPRQKGNFTPINARRAPRKGFFAHLSRSSLAFVFLLRCQKYSRSPVCRPESGWAPIGNNIRSRSFKLPTCSSRFELLPSRAEAAARNPAKSSRPGAAASGFLGGDGDTRRFRSWRPHLSVMARRWWAVARCSHQISRFQSRLLTQPAR